MRTTLLTLLTLLTLSALSCEGSIVGPLGLGPDTPNLGSGGGIGGGAGGGGGGGGVTQGPFEEPSPYVCDPAATVPSEAPLRRLSRTEFVNTLHLVITTALPTSGAAVEQGLASDLARLPVDALVHSPLDAHGGFSRLDQSIQQTTVDVSYDLAVAFGTAATSSTARLTELMGACATDASSTNDAQCLTDFVVRFGALTQRHPLTSTEVDAFKLPAVATPVLPIAVADVVALMLLAPGFLYQVELGGAQLGTGRFALTDSELAARLSYHFWNSPPDAQLLAAVRSGALATPAGYDAQVARLLDDPRARPVLDEFFSEWFRLEELEPLDSRITDPVFQAFSGADLPGPTLRAEMLGEVLDAVDFTRTSGGSIESLLTENHAVARTDALARLYGNTRWDGVSAPALLGPSRSGLLTRAAFLATGSANTRPVMKGYRVRSALMCDQVPAPPNNVNAALPDLAPDATTRETVEAITEQAGTSCAGCHTTMLNPLGFVTESFDSLGRERTAQKLFDTAGAYLGERPIRTDVVPRVVLGDPRGVQGVAEAVQRVVESRKVESCFAREYYRFSHRRLEQAAGDGCSLAQLDALARQGASVRELLAAVAQQPAFKERFVP